MKLPGTFTEDKKWVNVIIETPFKSRNKYAYDPETGLFKLKKILPDGLTFPCDMGFIPHTQGEDGDPLDALVLSEESIHPGCWVECKLVGVIKAKQKKKGKKEERNDRFVLITEGLEEFERIKDISDLSARKLKAISLFFKGYNDFEDRKFKVLDVLGAKEALRFIKKQMK